MADQTTEENYKKPKLLVPFDFVNDFLNVMDKDKRDAAN